MLTTNRPAPEVVATSIGDRPIDLSGWKGRKVLIKFHRFSGCPVCRSQVQEFIDRRDELGAAGIETVVFMHSSRDKILPNFKPVPGVHIVPDREKKFYRAFGSEFSWKKLFSPASWASTFAAMARGYFPQFHRLQGGITGVPSDFLLDETGVIVDLNYGRHVGDSWSVSDVLGKGSSRRQGGST